MATNVDLFDIDSTFDYTANIVRLAVKETMEELGQRFISPSKSAKIFLNALKTNFAIEQIYERLSEPERKLILEHLSPREIVQLRVAGAFKPKEVKEVKPSEIEAAAAEAV